MLIKQALNLVHFELIMENKGNKPLNIRPEYLLESKEIIVT
jgi:hypothetical protein